MNKKIDIKENENIRMAVLALRGLVVFNGVLLHFDVGRDKSVKALEKSMEEGQEIFLVGQKEIRIDKPKKSDLYTIGTITKIKQILRLPGDNMRVMVEGISRGVLNEIVKETPYLVGDVTPIVEPFINTETANVIARVDSCKRAFELYCTFNPKISNDVILRVMDERNPSKLADYIASSLPLRVEDKQVILETISPQKRIEKMIFILNREVEILSIEATIAEKAKEQIDKNQKEYVLKEHLKAIQNELGDNDDIEAECEKYEMRIATLKVEEEVSDKLFKEVNRLRKTSSSSPEGGVIRTYLDTCLALPWNTETKDRVSLKKAKKMLDDDHYGMEKVKEHILELLAVRQLNEDMKGQIICLVGPPGVGKTSIGKSIASALNRNFARLSLGGVRDEADIRGHRKTYIGAMPGRIINALKQSGSKNCVMLFDEVDKMANDFRGDPAAALLEVFDSEQNGAFRDHYIELPFDLSKVLFVVTANTLDTIPRPLLDRMEIIELGSYTVEEKVKIAKNHLLPKQLKKFGVEKRKFSISDDTISYIIEGYTRESGVRTLERTIEKILRKSVVKIVEGTNKITITKENVSNYLGSVKFIKDELEKTDEIGIACGLAWTQVGGDILPVEVNIVDGTGKIELTGSLGDVMKESGYSAISYIRSKAKELNIDPNFYKEKDIHVHFPQGAIPKDGPSAGITMATAIISALSMTPVKNTVAMTGEVTIRGRVLPIGGLKEKTMAAYKAGIKTIIIPKENERDLEEVDKKVKENVQFVVAKTMEDVIAAALVDVKNITGFMAKEHENRIAIENVGEPIKSIIKQ